MKRLFTGIFCILLALGVGALFLFVGEERPRSELPSAEPGNERIAIRGLIEPGDIVNSPQDFDHLRLAKEAGANYIGIIHWIVADSDGSIVPTERAFLSSTIKRTRETIRLLHREGFKVWLIIRTPLQPQDPKEHPREFSFELNFDLYKGLSEKARDRFLVALKPKILEIAKLAQEERVEIFTPVAAGQLYLLLEPRSEHTFSFEWTDALLPEVRAIYRGELAQKIDLNPDTAQNKRVIEIINFESWDWVSSDVFGSSDGFPGGKGGNLTSYEDWRHIYNSLLNVLKEKQEKAHTKGIILGPELLGVEDTLEDIIVREKHYLSRNEITDRDREEARAKMWEMILADTMGRVDGYMFWNWWPGADLPATTITKVVEGKTVTTRIANPQGRLPYEVIKQYYRKPQSE